MRVIGLILLACLSLQAEAEVNYIREYFRAEGLEKAGKLDEALEAYRRSYEGAVKGRNADYGVSAGLRGVIVLYGQNDRIGAGKLAREVLLGLEPLQPVGPDQGAMRRAQLFGYMERGYLAEGKIGAGWRANRALAETLRGRKMSPDEGGNSVTVADLDRVSKPLRHLVWRLIEREAEYLSLMGRTAQETALLEAADEKAAALEEWRSPVERFYAFKVRKQNVAQLDFLGFAREALELQEALLAGANEDLPIQSVQALHFNTLRNRSQWYGPSEEILEEARELAKDLMAHPVTSVGVERLLAKMELDLKESENAVETLVEEIGKHEARGEMFEAAYAKRDSLVALSKLDREGLDSEFLDVLKRMRAQGNKRGEPGVYADYGYYLKRQERYGEAIEMMREALRLVRVFDRPLHEVPYLGILMDCHLAMGDLEGARAVLAELDALLRAHPEIPAERRVDAEYARAVYLAATGDLKGVRAAFAAARKIGEGLPEWQMKLASPKVEEAVIAASVESSEAVVAGVSVQLQPSEVVSVSLPERVARARFTVSNRGAGVAKGDLTATGPGAEVDGEGGIRFRGGEERKSVTWPLRVAAGELADVPLELGGGTAGGESRIELEWGGGGVEDEASWVVSWDPESRGNVVLDASLLDANAFRSLVFHHHLVVPAGDDDPIAFRLVSPRELRIEYYDGESGELLAVDDNGNGEFEGVGEFHVVGPDDVAAAWVPVTGEQELSVVEIRLYSTGEGLAPIGASEVTLEAQTFVGGEWRTESENVLR